MIEGSNEYQIAVLNEAIRMAKDTASLHKDNAIGRWAIGRIVDLEAQKIRLGAVPEKGTASAPTDSGEHK